VLTSFRQKKEVQKPAQALEGTLQLLSKTLESVLHENTQRVYIEDKSYMVDFKLPAGIDLAILKRALEDKKLQPHETKTIDDVLIYTYQVLPNLDRIIEVWYRPVSMPRI